VTPLVVGQAASKKRNAAETSDQKGPVIKREEEARRLRIGRRPKIDRWRYGGQDGRSAGGGKEKEGGREYEHANGVKVRLPVGECTSPSAAGRRRD